MGKKPRSKKEHIFRKFHQDADLEGLVMAICYQAAKDYLDAERNLALGKAKPDLCVYCSSSFRLIAHDAISFFTDGRYEGYTGFQNGDLIRKKLEEMADKGVYTL